MRYAVDLARRAGATLHVLYAEPVFMESTALPGLYDEELEKVRKALSRLGPPEEAALGPERIRVAVAHGLTAESVICRYARHHEIDLVVTGTHGRTGWQRWLRGSVAESVVRRAGRSVLVVPTGEHDTARPSVPPVRTFVAAVSGVRDARAVEEARSLAALYGARMTVLHVTRSGDGAAASTASGRRHLEAWVEQVPGPDVQVACEVLMGAPAAVIPPYVHATGTGLLVLGPHVRRGGLFQPDHVRQLVRSVACPVYVAREGPVAGRSAPPSRPSAQAEPTATVP